MINIRTTQEIELLRASRDSSIHEYRQLFNERMKLKEEIDSRHQNTMGIKNTKENE